jgi:alpha-L-rhamnosidase
MKKIFFLVCVQLLALSSSVLASAIDVNGMKVNNLENPLGIDRSPVFSWKLSSTQRGVVQTAYQLVVTNADGTELWNTGKVSSDKTSSIRYAGAQLASSTAYSWKVKVWTNLDSESEWSTSGFETALLSTSEWKAQWISSGDELPVYTLTPEKACTTRYVRLSATKLGLSVKSEDGKYRIQLAEVEIMSGGKNVAKGCKATISPEETYGDMWKAANLTDGIVYSGAQVGGTTTAYSTATPSPAPYIDIDLGQSYAIDEVRLYPRNDVSAASDDERCANFPVDFSLSSRTDATSAFVPFYQVEGISAPALAKGNQVPVFGKKFNLTKAVKRARIYASGLGDFVLRVNGQRVTDNVLEPGETDYTKTVLYATYDITDRLVQGENTVLSAVGGAQYNNPSNDRYSKFNRIYGPQRFIAQLLIDYTDGTSETIVTGPDWKQTTGATTFSSWYGGEDYNANLYNKDMFTADCPMEGWKNAAVCTVAVGKMTAQFYPPTKVVSTWKAATVTSPAAGVYVVDFGQNFAGQYAFTLSQPANTQIKLYPTERINASGTADQTATGSPRYDTYTFSGTGAETWGPEWMYHGFRYLVVYGLKTAPTPDMFTAKKIRSGVAETGKVETSNTLLNDIHRIIVAAIESNLYNTLTDCPHREKLGWLEVPQLMFNSISYNFDMAAWWPKVALDTHDAQYASGYVPNVAPHHVTFSEYWDNDPSWGGSTILVPYRNYKFYGDESLIRSAYPTMVKLMNYYKTRSQDNLITIACLGDWGCYDKATTVGFTINCTYYLLAKAMTESADLLGYDSDRDYYSQLAEDIRQAVNTKYLKDGVYDAGTQADDAMALYDGIADAKDRVALVGKLMDKVKASDYHITTGEVALKPLFMALSDNGLDSVVYTMATKTDMPSYGYFIKQGATTLPEFWDMKESLNHCMMGHLDEWFYSGLGGIKNESIGFKKLKIAPYFGKDLSWVKVETDGGSGRIASSWNRSGNGYTTTFEVPVNSTAEIVLPASDQSVITEDGKVINVGNGIQSITKDSAAYHVTVGSGVYHFVVSDSQATSIHGLKTSSKISVKRVAGGVRVETPSPTAVYVYGMDGRLERVQTLREKYTFIPLRGGCHIINHTKVMI